MSSSSTDKTPIMMPQMGVSVAEGTVSQWSKEIGDPIKADETIVEISTDKIETELPSPVSGYLAEILVEVGETVEVGSILGYISATSPDAVTPVIPSDAAGARPGELPDKQIDQPDKTLFEDEPSQTGKEGEKEPPISPVVMRMAQAENIDLKKLKGSGRRGRVTKQDILSYLEKRNSSRPEPTLHIESPYQEPAPEPRKPLIKPATTSFTDSSDQGGAQLSLMRKRIGEHMRRSLDTAAHCTTIMEVDMSRVEELRGKLTYLPYVAEALIKALRVYPVFNSTLENELLYTHEDINLGIAVSLGERGLIVPVIPKAHEYSVEGLANRIRDLATRARANQLNPEEVKGGTFSITNPGQYGALMATPIINQPQVAILDLEAVTKRVVAIDNAIAIKPMSYLCLSWDHRVVDGALAAQFLSKVKEHIEKGQSP